MGCDIHAYAERRNEQGEWELVPGEVFDFRSYGIFAFLAGVRNYSAITPIAPARDFPEQASKEVTAWYKAWGCDAHTPSWLTLEELLAFDYWAQMEDRRCVRQMSLNSWSGGKTCEPGEGRVESYREFLGDGFIEELQSLAARGAERIVFWFDN